MQQVNQPGIFRCGEVSGSGLGVLQLEHHVGLCVDRRLMFERSLGRPWETAADGGLAGVPLGDRTADVGPFLTLGFLALLLGADGGFLTLPTGEGTGRQEGGAAQAVYLCWSGAPRAREENRTP